MKTEVIQIKARGFQNNTLIYVIRKLLKMVYKQILKLSQHCKQIQAER